MLKWFSASSGRRRIASPVSVDRFAQIALALERDAEILESASILGVATNRLSCRGDRTIEILELPENDSQVVARARVAGLQLHRQPVFGERCCHVSGRLERDSEVGMGFSQVGIEPDGLAEGGDRLDVFTPRFKDGTEVGPGRRIVGLEPDGFSSRGECSFKVAAVQESRRLIRIGICIRRVKANRLAMLGDLTVQIAFLPQRDAQVVVEHGKAGVKPESLSVSDDGAVLISEGLPCVA